MYIIYRRFVVSLALCTLNFTKAALLSGYVCGTLMPRVRQLKFQVGREEVYCSQSCNQGVHWRQKIQSLPPLAECLL